MYSRKPSVSQAIREIIFSNSIFHNALRIGIANYTALALKIKPAVEKITGSEVSINTIVVGIKRLADIVENNNDKLYEDSFEAVTGVRLSLTGSILDVDFGKEYENLEKIFDIFDKDLDIRFNIFQTKDHFKLFVENIGEVKSIFTNDRKILPNTIKDGISMINIILPWSPNEIEKTYQLLAVISNILYNNRVLLHNAFFTPNEIVLIVNENDAAKVYELLRLKLYR